MAANSPLHTPRNMSDQSLSEDQIETSPCRYGLISYLRSDQLIGRSLREYGEWAQGEIDLLLSLARPGDTVVDAGAFIGTHTLALSQAVAPEGAVLSFEPHPVAFQLLQRNIRQNSLSNVSAANIALSDSRKQVRIPAGDLSISENPGQFALPQDEMADVNAGEYAAIEMSTLDRRDLQSCHLIKVDVEGMELAVLRGCTDTLERFEPIVLAECLSLEAGWRLTEFMRSKGFFPYLHNVPSFNPSNFRKNDENFLGASRETNFVLVPRNRVAEFQSRCADFESLIPIETADDLVLGLLKKPQYKYEVLDHTAAAGVIGNRFWASQPEVDELQKTLRSKAQSLQRLEQEISDVQHQLQESRASAEAAQHETDRLQDELKKGKANAQRLREQLRGVRAKLEELDRYSKTLQKELEASKSEGERIQAENDVLRLELADSRNEMAVVYASRSWRLTRPLRSVAAAIRRFASSLRIAAPPEVEERLAAAAGQPMRPILDAESRAIAGFHGYLDKFITAGDEAAISGWAFHEQHRIESASVVITHQGQRETFPLAYGAERMDVFQANDHENALRSGFFGKARMPSKAPDSVALRFRLANDELVEAHVRTPALKQERRNPFRSLRTLMSSLNLRRLKLALRFIARGQLGYVRDRSAALLRTKTDPPPYAAELAASASCFSAVAPEAPPLEQEIDIIVPVHNGVHLLDKLFTSLFHNTQSAFRLILINDASTDPAVQPALEQVAEKHENVVLLTNDENQGFVKSVNLAAAHARNHFVLLNTDVEVPEGWLRRLMRPIVSDAKIASTTPFTNAGTICSFPTPNQDNQLFADLDLEAVDSVFRLINAEQTHIELPTGIGFCMGVNLDAWREVGPFDDQRFGRGYGEENDWSMRARAVGYRNVLAPDLFVYHKHGATFGQIGKDQDLPINLQKVHALHPTYQSLVDRFIAEDPLVPLRTFAQAILSTRASLKDALLVIDHELGGGANLYRRERVRQELESGRAVLLLSHDRAWEGLKLKVLYGEHEAVFRVSTPEDLALLKGHLSLGEVLYNNMVSFENPSELIALLPGLKKRFGSKLTVAVHDYLPLCPSYTLLDYQGRFCDLPPTDYCDKCLPKNPHSADPSAKDVRSWRNAWQEVFATADEILCFSESSRTLLQREFDLRGDRLVVRPHELPTKFSKKPKFRPGGRLNIGVVGAINYAKGAQMVVEVARILQEEDPQARVTVIGRLNAPQHPRNLVVTGEYNPEDLPSILEKHAVNVCFFPSVWPETFSYVLSELMELGMPICCFDLGAQAERIADYPRGRIIPEVNAQASVREMQALLEHMHPRGT